MIFQSKSLGLGLTLGRGRSLMLPAVQTGIRFIAILGVEWST
jgi:hypothetical protein